MKKLPENVRCLINASIQLNNHTKAVEELVYNSLDAGATSVAIRVNIEENIIQVIDNGCGVTKRDLNCVGKNYMTSKFTDLSTLKSAPNKYGFRGQSLANLINISKSVIVTSRHENSEETWKKIFENGKERLLDKCDIRPSKGTTVEVKGFLYNLNINKIDTWRDLYSIKTFLEHLSLVHSNISLSLRDDLKNEIIFKMHKSRDIYQTLSTLYDIEKGDIEEFKVEKNEYKVRGILGKTDKECERNDIFLNGKYISECNKLHKTVNSYIKKHLHLTDRRIRKIKNINEENCTKQNKITFYFIFITCPYLDYNLSSPKQAVLEFKDWNQINKLLEKLIKFSAGDVNLKELTNRNKPICNQRNTREEVKKIMEKILGPHSKKSIPHVHKGVKGKQIKRKKQLSMNKLVTKEIRHDNTKNNNRLRSLEDVENEHNNSLADILLGKDNLTNKVKKSYKLSKTQQKNKKKTNKPEKRTVKNVNKVGKVYNSTFKKVSKNKERVAKELEPKNKRLRNKTISNKKQKLSDNLMRKFEMNTYSVQKRCSELSQQVKKALKERNKKKTKVHDMTESVHFSNITENIRNVSVRKKINEIVTYRYLPKSNNYNKPCVNQIKAKEKIFQSNYDLLETILRTQEENNERKIISRQPLPISIDCSTQHEVHDEVYRPVDLETGSNFIEPFVTFESHNYYARKNYNSTSDQNSLQMGVSERKSLETEEHYYNLDQREVSTIDLLPTSVPDDSVDLNKKPKKFTTKKSKDNFSIKQQSEKYTKSSVKNKYSKQLTSNIKNMFKQTPRPFRVNHFISTTEKSYTIDFTDSNRIINISDDDNMNIADKDGTNSIKNTYSMNIEEIWTQSAKNNKNEARKDDRVIINTTYTLSSSKQQTVKNNNKYYGTYTIEHYTNENPIHQENISCNTGIINENYIFVSKSQEQEQIETMDPVTMCETILQSHEVMDDELELVLNSEPYSSMLDHINHNNKSDNDNQNGADEVEFTDISLNCGQNRERGHCEDLLERSSLPNTEFQSNFDMLEDVILGKKAVEIENNNIMVIDKDQHNTDAIENTENDGFNFKNRPCFLPKGMSPIFENCNTKNVGECNLSRDYYEDEMYNNFIDNVRNNAEVFEPKIQEAQDVATKAIDKVNAMLNKDSASLKFDGMCLRDAKVLGQVDDKFIAAIIKGGCSKGEVSDFLVLFDQHAVHERIRLENNLSEYLVNNQWVSIAIDEVTLKISKDEALYLHNYKEKFTQLGLQWTLLNYDEVTFSAIPTAILGKNVREVEKVIKAVKSLITEEINMIRMQSGCASLYPKSIMDLVFSEACRYAIKFGEKLSRSRCVELLKTLSECKTPFQCAHGRPAMAVIMEIKRDNSDYVVNLQKVKEWKAKTGV